MKKEDDSKYDNMFNMEFVRGEKKERDGCSVNKTKKQSPQRH